MIEDEDIRRDYLMGIYNAVLLKDIVARKRINDVPLLESVIKFFLTMWAILCLQRRLPTVYPLMDGIPLLSPLKSILMR